jgi:hypothetical protein
MLYTYLEEKKLPNNNNNIYIDGKYIIKYLIRILDIAKHPC